MTVVLIGFFGLKVMVVRSDNSISSPHCLNAPIKSPIVGRLPGSHVILISLFDWPYLSIYSTTD